MPRIPYLGKGSVAERIIVLLSIGYRSYITIIKELGGNERNIKHIDKIYR